MGTEPAEQCGFCRKERPRNEMRQHEIIYRGTHPRTGRTAVLRKTNWYCKDTFCGGKDQMGHEG